MDSFTYVAGSCVETTLSQTEWLRRVQKYFSLTKTGWKLYFNLAELLWTWNAIPFHKSQRNIFSNVNNLKYIFPCSIKFTKLHQINRRRFFILIFRIKYSKFSPQLHTLFNYSIKVFCATLKLQWKYALSWLAGWFSFFCAHYRIPITIRKLNRVFANGTALLVQWIREYTEVL